MPITPLKEIHRSEIRSLLDLSDLNVSTLAANAGVAREGLSRWLSGAREGNPTCDWLDALYRALYQDHRSKLKRLMKEGALNQKSAAKQAKVTQRGLARFLSGKDTLSAAEIERLYALKAAD